MLNILLSKLDTEEEKSVIEKLYHRYEHQMYNTAYSLLKHRQEAEDAVQNAFLKVIEYLPNLHISFDMQTQALMTVITKNVALNQIKKRKRQFMHEVELAKTEASAIRDDIEELSRDEIQEMIMKLPDDLKNVIIMRFILDYSAEDTARLLDISPSAVYKRVASARKLLKDFIVEAL